MHAPQERQQPASQALRTIREKLEEIHCRIVEQMMAEHEEEKGAEGVGLRRDLVLKD